MSRQSYKNKEGDTNDMSRYTYLRSLDTETLHSMLEQLSSPEKTFDADTVTHIIDVLLEREGGLPDADVELALAECKKRVADAGSVVGRTRYRRRRRWPMFTAAAVIVVLLSSSILSAVGFDVWGFVVGLRRSTFSIGRMDHIASIEPARGITDPNISIMIANAEPEIIDEFVRGITGFSSMPSFPDWLPNGFVLTDVNVLSTQNSFVLRLTYTSEEGSFIYRLTDSQMVMTGEINVDEYPTVYTVGDVTHFIDGNFGQTRAVWIDENVQCTINGDLTEEEVKKIIDSIYGG